VLGCVTYNARMILGLGVDSIEIARVAAKCQGSGSRFAEKLFTAVERARADRYRANPYQHLAACFAAREAFFKATQIWYGRDDVSVSQLPSGEPYYVLAEHVSAKLSSLATRPGLTVRVHLSLTRDGIHATAFCICEEL
jgi:holo-[acyl-carrier protein] synthase